MQHEPTLLAHRHLHELIAHQRVGMLVEYMTISPFRFLVRLVMIPFGKCYVNAVVSSSKQGFVFIQQDVKSLRGPGKEKVASDGNLIDPHLPANV